MLETDEVDIDYFTPAGGTSLANIFGKNSVSDEKKENTSLKYVPPPPPEKSKLQEVKPTQWIFTCVVHGFEWINSEYISRGKLGLAILKVVKTNSHSIILYDSNKKTVSYVSISPKLNIHIRDILTISYYDNAQKYWSIKTSDDDMNKILQLVKDLQATIVPKSLQDSDREQSDIIKINNKDEVEIKDEEHKQGQETDTDFDMNQRTKESILKRMANMGHSVLPSHGNLKERTSDSSDSNNIDESKKNIRHKPTKPPKKATDSGVQDYEGNIPFHSRKYTHKMHMDSQPVAPTKSTTTFPCGGDVNVLLSEQTISNSELRINVNRVSDKLDVVLERLNDIHIDKCTSPSNFQNDIVQKLIKEYESKIKSYEYIMSSKGINFQTIMSPVKTHTKDNVFDKSEDIETNLNKIDQLENYCREKDNIITDLKTEICVLKENSIRISEDSQKNIDELVLKVEALNKDINLKKDEFDNLKRNCNNGNTSNQDSYDITNKVKKIMNDTFEAISVNFDNAEAYSGENIKAIIAVVIKKTTIQALQDL